MAPKKKTSSKKASKATAKKKQTARKDTCESAGDVQYSLIQSRLASYKLDVVKEREGWEIDETSSFKALKNYGIVYNHEENEAKYWVCLANSACAESCDHQGWKMNIHKNDRNQWVTSNINRHLRAQHGIITEGSEKQALKSVAENQYRHELLQAFKNNMPRLGELQWVLMMILCRLPISFGSYKVVKDTMALTGIDELKRNLHRVKVNHIISEIYSQILTVARQQILDAKKAHGDRIFSINIDNWKSKNSIRKFMGIRLYFNDHKMQFQNWMLAVREFKPSSQMRQGPTGLRRAMEAWARAILLHYGIKYEDIFSATTDKAGDVRILNQLDIETNWDWCIPHMINCALYFAFSLARNPWMHGQIAAMKDAVNSIRDLTKDGNLFEEILIEENPEVANKMLQTHQEQRFMGVYLTCTRYYEMFETINETCLAAGIVSKVKITKSELKELISVLKPLRNISVSSQTQRSAYGFRVLQKLIHERLSGVLNLEKCVTAFNDESETISTFCAGVTRTRKLLIDAVDLKFFKRYFQKTKTTKSGDVTVQSYLLECQHLLHPALRNLNPVMDVIELMVKTDSAAIISWTTKNKKAGVRYAKNLLTRKLSNRSMVELSNDFFEKKKNEYIVHVQQDIHDTVKNHIIDSIIQNNRDPEQSEDFFGDVEEDEFEPRQRNLQFASLEAYVTEQQGETHESSTGARRPVQSAVRRISHCMETYLKASTSHQAFRNRYVNCNVVEWKEIHGSSFPDVVSAFAAYFGVPTSSAGIELDFYFASLLLTKQRMSMKGPLIEMMQMIDRNRKWVDLTQVNRLTTPEAIAMHPKFVELEECMASDDEEDMNHAEEDDEESDDESGDEEGQFEANEYEKKRVDLQKKRAAERKKKEEQDILDAKEEAEETERFETELRKNLQTKQKLADLRKLERLKYEKQQKKKAEKEEEKKASELLQEEMRKNQVRRHELETKVAEQEARRNKEAAEKKKEDEYQEQLKQWEQEEREDFSMKWKEEDEERKAKMKHDDDAKKEEAEKKRLAAKKAEAELERLATKEQTDRVEKKDQSTSAKEKNENMDVNEQVRASRPNHRHNVKDDTNEKFIAGGKINRHEMLEKKRIALRNEILSAGRRIDLVASLEREKQKIDEELGDNSEEEYFKSNRSTGINKYIFSGSDDDEQFGQWDEESEYQQL